MTDASDEPMNGTRAAASRGAAWGAEVPVEEHRIPLAVRLIGVFLLLFALLSVLCGLTSAFAALLYASSKDAVARETSSLAVPGASTFAIHAAAGVVRVVAGAPSRISYALEKHVRAFTQEQAQHELARIRVTLA